LNSVSGGKGDSEYSFLNKFGLLSSMVVTIFP